MVDEAPGYPRTYFYRRFARAVHEVLMREIVQEEQEPEMVSKVNLQEALDRLKSCPVCSSDLGWSPDYPLEKSCACGDFTITDVWTDGDVSFEFKLAAPEKIEVDNTPVDDPGE